MNTSFEASLNLLASGNLKKIRRGLRKTEKLGADISGVAKALERLVELAVFELLPPE
jgi:hypothetical protein